MCVYIGGGVGGACLDRYISVTTWQPQTKILALPWATQVSKNLYWDVAQIQLAKTQT